MISASSERIQLPEGYRLGDYELGPLLGMGGGAVTYRARAGGGEPVAVKEFLPAGLAVRRSDGTVAPSAAENAAPLAACLAAFRDEARRLCSIDYPNVVRVRTVIEANGTAYSVMEMVEGVPLNTLLQQSGPLDRADIVDVVHGLLDGLEAVHAAGLLHLDVTPANIMIDREGRPVLVDFGRARLLAHNASPELVMIVAPLFAPFELYEREGRRGPWSDIYGLAATARYLISGRLPDDAPTRLHAEIMGVHSETQEPAAADAFAAAIDAGFALMAENRPQSIAAWRRLFPPRD